MAGEGGNYLFVLRRVVMMGMGRGFAHAYVMGRDDGQFSEPPGAGPAPTGGGGQCGNCAQLGRFP